MILINELHLQRGVAKNTNKTAWLRALGTRTRNETKRRREVVRNALRYIYNTSISTVVGFANPARFINWKPVKAIKYFLAYWIIFRINMVVDYPRPTVPMYTQTNSNGSSYIQSLPTIPSLGNTVPSLSNISKYPNSGPYDVDTL